MVDSMSQAVRSWGATGIYADHVDWHPVEGGA
jgi:hypothetical protein